jgi:hypothetical protein
MIKIASEFDEDFTKGVIRATYNSPVEHIGATKEAQKIMSTLHIKPEHYRLEQRSQGRNARTGKLYTNFDVTLL